MKTTKFSVRDMTLIAMFSALVAVGAFIRIPIPPAPFTLQVTMTTLAGLILGKRNGALSVILYVAIGLLGVPIFTKGGGIGYVLEPTFGYFIGFAIGAYVTGAISHAKENPSFKRILCASLTGLLISYVCGMVYAYVLCNFVLNTPIGISSVLVYYFLIFLPKDVVLCVLTSLICKKIIPILDKNFNIGYNRKGIKDAN